MAITIGADFEQSMTNLLSSYVTSTSSLLCSALVPVAIAGVTLYIMIVGYNVIFGRVSEPAREILMRFFKIIFVSALALNQGVYQSYIVDFFNAIPAGIIQTLGLGAGVGAMLDNMFDPLISILNNYSAKVSLNFFASVMLICVLFFYMIVSVVLIVSALGYFILTKIAIAVLFGIGPLWIFVSLFPATQKFTESWMGQVLQYIFLQILLAAVIALVGKVTIKYATVLNANINTANPASDLIAIIVVLMGCIVVFFNLNQIASALSGGVGLSGMSHAVSNAAARKLFGPKSPVTPKTPKPNAIEKPSLRQRAANAVGRGASRLYNNLAGKFAR